MEFEAFLIKPVFSSLDNELVSTGSDRDPLGLQNIWSSYGHQIFPGLSGAIHFAEGLLAVCLNYHLYDEELIKELDDTKINFRTFFSVMEQYYENYWYLNYSDKEIICYGKRTVGPEALIQLNNSSTYANGLYRFYRGTCKNIGLLTVDLTSLSISTKKLFQDHFPIDDVLKKEIKSLLSQSIDNVTFNSLKLSSMKELMNKFFKNSSVRSFLYNKVLPEGSVRTLATQFVKSSDPWEKTIFLLSQDSKNIDSKTKNNLQNILMNEPFMILITELFQWIRQQDEVTNIKKLEELLKSGLNDHKSELSLICEKFLTLPVLDTHNIKRFEKLRSVAKKLKKDMCCVHELLEYHDLVYVDRPENPLVQNVEGTLLHDPIDNSFKGFDTILDRCKTEWYNRYYISTAMNLFQQLDTASSNGGEI